MCAVSGWVENIKERLLIFLSILGYKLQVTVMLDMYRTLNNATRRTCNAGHVHDTWSFLKFFGQSFCGYTLSTFCVKDFPFYLIYLDAEREETVTSLTHTQIVSGPVLPHQKILNLICLTQLSLKMQPV